VVLVVKNAENQKNNIQKKVKNIRYI